MKALILQKMKEKGIEPVGSYSTLPGIIEDIVADVLQELTSEPQTQELEPKGKNAMLVAAQQQERYLLNLRETLDKRGVKFSDNKSHQYERAKLIGMVDMLNAVGIDSSEFNWIYNI